jgi:hypothetical protein
VIILLMFDGDASCFFFAFSLAIWFSASRLSYLRIHYDISLSARMYDLSSVDLSLSFLPERGCYTTYCGLKRSTLPHLTRKARVCQQNAQGYVLPYTALPITNPETMKQ